ncbi:MAG: hypothetical protein ACLFTI_03235 [Anaerolineales bacterium]
MGVKYFSLLRVKLQTRDVFSEKPTDLKIISETPTVFSEVYALSDDYKYESASEDSSSGVYLAADGQ